MTSLKNIFSSLLLLLVVCSFGKAEAGDKPQTGLPIYHNVISNISLGYEDAMLIGTIKLDNGMVMRIVDYNNRDDNVLKTWKAGDVVAFEAHVKEEALILSAKRIFGPDEDKVEPYVIFDVTKPTTGLIIAEINDEGKFIKLGDNSVWEFSWFNRLSSKYWKVGERVIVHGEGDKNSYEFINLDAPVSENVAHAKASFVAH